MVLRAVVAVLVFISISVCSFSSEVRVYKAKVIDVYDGDTFDVEVDLGFKVTVKDRVRLRGVDAPEIRTKDKKEKRKAVESRDYVRGLIEGKVVDLSVYGYDKYGRVLGDVDISGESLSGLMMKNGYARSYDGGQR